MPKVRSSHYRLVVSGAGPAGLSAALAAIRFGLAPTDVLVLEARRRDEGPGGYGSRTRVIILDGQTSRILAANMVAPPGAKLRFMTVAIDQKQLAYIPNRSGWRTVFEGVVGPRHLDRLTTIAELEERLLSRLLALGGTVRFGHPAELLWSDDGTARVEVGGTSVSADLIAIAEGDQSPNAAAIAKKVLVTPEQLSAFITVDLAAAPNGTWEPGDLLAAFHEPTGRLVYGYAAPQNLSISTLLPDNGEPERGGMEALGTFAAAFGLPADPGRLDTAIYRVALSMSDRCLAGANVVLVGDALRASDPVSGAGANAAIFDGDAVGAFFVEEPAIGGIEARARLVARLRQSTMNAIELSLLFREQARYWLGNPGLYRVALRMGLRSRNSEGLSVDTAKAALAELPRILMGEQLHAALIRGAASVIGVPPAAFGSEERRKAIGLPHPKG